ncbi:MAG: hypothetical protein WCP97_08410 [bacterium]
MKKNFKLYFLLVGLGVVVIFIVILFRNNQSVTPAKATVTPTVNYDNPSAVATFENNFYAEVYATKEANANDNPKALYDFVVKQLPYYSGEFIVEEKNNTLVITILKKPVEAVKFRANQWLESLGVNDARQKILPIQWVIAPEPIGTVKEKGMTQSQYDTLQKNQLIQVKQLLLELKQDGNYYGKGFVVALDKESQTIIITAQAPRDENIEKAKSWLYRRGITDLSLLTIQWK